MIRSVADGFWRIICFFGGRGASLLWVLFGIKATCSQRISVGTTVHEMHVCHFPSRVIRLYYVTTKRIAKQMSITTSTITEFSLATHKWCLCVFNAAVKFPASYILFVTLTIIVPTLCVLTSPCRIALSSRQFLLLSIKRFQSYPKRL
jgi:hypothetical protein